MAERTRGDAIWQRVINGMNLRVEYDRWREKVFEPADQKTGWDGTYNGKLLNTAVFVYDLEATLMSCNINSRTN
ncbi:MAG: gliding motility-associated C-terminal domain-containing protein [Bacteroidetes bacterium]|nr:gliding motility-associated C-terminal domain-containing protein [Bacteroidota bacterium]